MSVTHYTANPWLFGSLSVGCLVFIVLLLAQGLGVLGIPRQGEPTAVNVLAIRQSGMFYASGVQTAHDMEKLMRECLGVRDLPPPSALVKGDVRDKANWQEITPEQGARIVQADQAAFNEKLKEIVAGLASEVVETNLVWAPQKVPAETDSESVVPPKRENLDK